MYFQLINTMKKNSQQTVILISLFIALIKKRYKICKLDSLMSWIFSSSVALSNTLSLLCDLVFPYVKTELFSPEDYNLLHGLCSTQMNPMEFLDFRVTQI